MKITNMLFYFRVVFKPFVYCHFRKNPRKIHTHIINHALNKKQGKVKIGRISNEQKILNHFNSAFLNNEREKLSDNLFRTGQKLNFLYLMNEEVAKKIINSINKDLLEGSNCIIEANPGFGFITKQLISLDCLKIKVFEPDSYFNNHMKKMEVQHSDILKVYHKNLSHLGMSRFREREDQRIKLLDVIKPMETKQWSDECSIKIIGSCPNDNFLRQYVQNIIFQQGFFRLGRPQLFLLLDLKTYSLLNPQNNIMRTYPVLFKLFFHTDYVLSVDKHNFLPWFDTKLMRSLKKCTSDMDQLFLVKITGRKDLFERIGGTENMKSLWFFLTQLCKSLSTRVIPTIEKWVPGYGYRLLLSSIDAFTEVQDLDPEKVLDLFLTFSSWPEIQNSPYSSALESFTERKVTGNTSDTEEEVSPEEEESVSEFDSDVKNEES